MRVLALVVMVLGWAALGLANEHAGSSRSEALTDASSLGGSRTAAGERVGGNVQFDWNKLYKPGSPGRGPCCRICPNTFYAVPRIVPRLPEPKVKTKKVHKPAPGKLSPAARRAKFREIFERAEPPHYASDDYVFLQQQIERARAEDARTRRSDGEGEDSDAEEEDAETEEDIALLGFAEHMYEYANAGAAADADAERRPPSGPKMPRWRGPEVYPEWPLTEYTRDPYQDQPIPEFTPEAALPGINCCNVCGGPGVGQIKYPQMLKWGQSPATDAYPQEEWKIPCCKLCSSGCYSNGEKRPPNVPLRKGEPMPGAEPAEEVIEIDPADLPPVDPAFVDANSTLSARERVEQRAAVRRGVALTETGATSKAGRPPRPLQARGNWPKQMDPPGANRPVVPVEKSCAPMVGCCNMCYASSFIFSHAPSGIW